MRDTQELAEWILKEIARINPYHDKARAFTWATGFLARCCAEMIWRDNHNLEIFRKIREKNTRK